MKKQWWNDPICCVCGAPAVFAALQRGNYFKYCDKHKEAAMKQETIMEESGLISTEMWGGATLSLDRKYRYELIRVWDERKPCLLWIMLNPSTADATNDDATIRKCITFAKRDGAGGIHVVNLFALRCTSPTTLKKMAELCPVGEWNDQAIYSAASWAHHMGKRIVVAWGQHGKHMNRAENVLRLLSEFPLWSLGFNKDGSPIHPLYVNATRPFEAVMLQSKPNRISKDERFHPPLPPSKVPEIASMYVTNESSRYLYDYIEHIPTEYAHNRAYKARLQMCPKVNVGTWPKQVVDRLDQSVVKRLMAILVMFDGTAAVLTVRETVKS